MSLITGVRHPYWTAKSIEWTKWRAVYDGGPNFIENYLKQYSSREDIEEFKKRKAITPTPNFAKAAINDVRNAIFQRLTDVKRRDGSDSYQSAIKGEDFGVDLQGSSMNAFIGRELLAELLVMSRVGVFVDMPQIEGKTLRDMVGVRPYLYKYRAEDILSWTEKPGSPDEFVSVLLRDYVEIHHDETSLPCGTSERYRHMYIGADGKCHVAFYKEVVHEDYDPLTGAIKKSAVKVDVMGMPTVEDLILEINFIPFVLVDIGDSLLGDVANHQIALLNLESSDISYSLKSNFPFYVEQTDFRAVAPHMKPHGGANADGTAAAAAASTSKEIQVGTVNGRQYGKDLQAPQFIHPSSEPLKASMMKQQALKDDIRTLVNLNLSNIGTKMASAESKQMDDRGLESGLSSIGLVLEHCERRIEFYWRHLEGKPKDKASVKYPEKWSLKSDADRREDAKHMKDLRGTIPSKTFQQSISKEIARLTLGDKISNDDIDKICAEIEKAQTYTSEPETIFQAIDRGVLDLELAAEILGWPVETVAKAAKQHAERLARISEAQAEANPADPNPAARGVKDKDGEPGQGGKDEKTNSRDSTADKETSDKTRGDGKDEAKL